jgi:hypothetical protein
LSIETLYSFRVATVTALGRSNYSVPLTNIITAPAAATDLSFNSPTLSWTDNSTTGTNVNLYYKVTGSSAAYTRISAVSPGYIAGGNKTLNITAPTLSSLPSGVNLTVHIRVVSSGKESSASNTISNVLRSGVLVQPPTGLTLSNITTTSVTLTWNTVTTDLSSSIVEYKKDTESSWTTINGVTGSTRAITGLDSGVLYNFRVSSVKNSGAVSAPSTVISGSTLALSIEPPTGLTLSNITATSVTLTWNTVTTDLSSSIVEYKKDTESSWTTINGITGSTRTITGLESEVLYNFRVSSVTNSGAVSASSTVISGSTVGALFWVAGGNGSNTLAWSDDGKVWENSNNSTNIFSGWGGAAKWNGSLWVAGGRGSSNKTIAWSDDGKVWNTATGSPFPEYCNAIMWSSSLSLWVAGGAGSSSTLAWSDDGKIWNSVADSKIIYPGQLNGYVTVLASSSSLMVAGGRGNSNLAWSTNGKDWNAGTGSPFSFCFAIAHNGSRWVAGGNGGGKIAWSDDGKNWNNVANPPFNESCLTVAWSSSQNLWVAGGDQGSILAWSDDGIAWNAATGSPFNPLCSVVAWNGTRWVAGGQGSGTLAWSDNGKDWTAVTSSPFNVLCTRLVWNGSLWVAGGESNQDHALAWSEDGKVWTGLGKTNFTSTYMIAAK